MKSHTKRFLVNPLAVVKIKFTVETCR